MSSTAAKWQPLTALKSKGCGLNSSPEAPGRPMAQVGELSVLPVVAFGCLLPLGRLLCCLAEELIGRPRLTIQSVGQFVGNPWARAIC
eukprot:s5591_g1.t1